MCWNNTIDDRGEKLKRIYLVKRKQEIRIVYWIRYFTFEEYFKICTHNVLVLGNTVLLSITVYKFRGILWNARYIISRRSVYVLTRKFSKNTIDRYPRDIQAIKFVGCSTEPIANVLWILKEKIYVLHIYCLISWAIDTYTSVRFIFIRFSHDCERCKDKIPTISTYINFFTYFQI